MNKISIIFLFALLSCAPIPIIQSSKVQSGYFFNTSIIQSNNRISKNDGSYLISAGFPKLHYGYGIGVKNRFEFGGIIIPFVFFDYWDINSKLFLFKIGNESKLFYNVSNSIFLCSDGYFNISGSWGPFIHGGCGYILGTFGSIFNQNIEFIFSPSLNYSSFSEWYGEADTTIDLDFKRKCMDFQFGIIINSLDIIEAGLGVTSSKLLYENIKGERADLVAFNKFTFQTAIRFNLKGR